MCVCFVEAQDLEFQALVIAEAIAPVYQALPSQRLTWILLLRERGRKDANADVSLDTISIQDFARSPVGVRMPLVFKRDA